MKNTLMIMLLAIFAAALNVGCAAPRDMSHGVLVDDWYVSLEKDGKFSKSLYWDAVDHQCKYKDGTVISVGRQVCP